MNGKDLVHQSLFEQFHKNIKTEVWFKTKYLLANKDTPVIQRLIADYDAKELKIP